MKKLNSILRFCLVASLAFVIFSLVYSFQVRRELNSTTIKKDNPIPIMQSQSSVDSKTKLETPVVNNRDLPISSGLKELPSNNQDSVDTEFTGVFDLFADEASNLETEKVKVSPFGFGEYPKIPDGFPFDNPWDVPTTNANFELMHRVQIKLWNEGKRPEGMVWENGKVYPMYPNTVYVKWDYYEAEDGSMERYISESTSGTLSPYAESLLDEGIIPPGVTVYDQNESGIDPYSYLGL